MKAPVVFLFFNRPHTARLVFENIREAKPRQLILVCDGPRSHVYGEKENVERLRRQIENMIDWPAKVETDYASENMGCGKRLASGIGSSLSKYGRAIILEDDCVPSASFFNYCDFLLTHYEQEDRITSISGTYFLRRSKRSADIGFTHFPCVWGWATWARAWKGYDRELKGWDDSFLDDIATEGHIPYFLTDAWKKTFRWVVENPASTWDVQFWFLSFKKRGLSIFPYRNQISNIGAGFGATHTTGRRFCEIPTSAFSGKLVLPTSITVDHTYEKYLQIEFYSNKTTWRNVGYKAIYKSGHLWKRFHEVKNRIISF